MIWHVPRARANGFLDVVRGAGVKDVYAVATLGGRSMIPQAFWSCPIARN